MDAELQLADGTVLAVDLLDTPVTAALAELLPLALDLSDFHGAEKIAYLPSKLDTASAPAGTSAEAGDLCYYAPWGNLALFYKEEPRANGLIKLGTVAASSADIAAIGEQTAVLRAGA
jgi:hypothetical protein